MDEIAAYNTRRWEALTRVDAFWSRPWFDLDADGARDRIDSRGLLGDLSGKNVLLVAGGGGQQSAAFAMLGASVTVTDLSEDQLERDRVVAAHHGLKIEALQADMRDLSALPAGSFDVVWQGYSINFVPDVGPVFAEIARVIRPGGVYRVECANPFFHGMSERDWNGSGYLLRNPYVEAASVICEDAAWVYAGWNQNGDNPVPPSREYRHTVATVVNGLIGHGFAIEHVTDQLRRRPPDPNSEPGTWDHFLAHCPQWLTFWSSHRPELTRSGY